jgi:hypothetical protein
MIHYYAKNGKKIIEFALLNEYGIFFYAVNNKYFSWSELKDYFVKRRMKIYDNNDNYIAYHEMDGVIEKYGRNNFL